MIGVEMSEGSACSHSFVSRAEICIPALRYWFNEFSELNLSYGKTYRK
jgi:hypothetical protein